MGSSARSAVVRNVVLAGLLAGLLATAANAAGANEVAIRALEQAQAKAAIAQDRGALDRIFAPDYVMVNPAGAITTRAELFKLLTGSTPPYKSATYETQLVRELGDVIVTTGLETVIGNTGPTAGQTVQRRTTQVWKRAGAGWQLTYRHASIVTAP